ncbi:MAG: sugar phosphate nucleotidyltransferase [Patescibacteria group bacterium]|nr:sugar phosphate nucleotidyltransferase [Patescibacteria group bacterium]MDD5490359.1 sugar phosphate nucleotidyltransferase [Patescibacteria group bacterium]
MNQKEYSAGAVIFRKANSRRKYLLLYSTNGYWSLPRGHIEKGETDVVAAKREIQEETGLKNLKFISGFKVRGGFVNKQKNINKDIVYFLAETKEKNITVSPPEHKGYIWVDYKEAMRRAGYSNTKNLLRQAEDFLNNRRGQMKLVIMAGGGGTRLWPISRINSPKQIHPLIGKDTLLQATWKRVAGDFKKEDIFVSSNIKYREYIKRQLPNLHLVNLILDPERKDTAAAIGLAALKLYHDNPRNILVTVNSDAHIKNSKEYVRILKLTERVASENPERAVLVGINPSYPETGYGYIKLGRQWRKIGQDAVFYGEKFVEKPDLETAKKYFKRWDYLWNPAIFVFRVDHLLDLYEKHLPEMYNILMNIYKALGGQDEEKIIREEFRKIKPISFDYGIMEKIGQEMLVIPADFGWSDVGHWRTIRDILAKKEGENVANGEYIGIDSGGNLVLSFSKKLIATVGVKNHIIVETGDAILICPQERAQEVKKVVAELKKQKLKKYL